MKIVEIAELSEQLDDCLAYAQDGEEVVLCENGKAFARILPIESRAFAQEDFASAGDELGGILRESNRRGAS